MRALENLEREDFLKLEKNRILKQACETGEALLGVVCLLGFSVSLVGVLDFFSVVLSQEP